MTLTYGLRTPRDLFEKLMRDAALLNDEVTSDRFFNFVLTGYSIIDWLKHEPSVSAGDVQSMYKNPWIRVCGELANASKHFKLDKQSTAVADTQRHQGWGRGRYGKGGWGVGEQQITLSLSDGSSIDCLEFVKRVIAVWEAFFLSHRL